MITYIHPELYNHFQPNGRKSKFIRAHFGRISFQSEPPINIIGEPRRMDVQRQRIKNGHCRHGKHRDAIVRRFWCRSCYFRNNGVIAVER